MENLVLLGIELPKLAWTITQEGKTSDGEFSLGVHIKTCLSEYLFQVAQKGTDARPLEI